MTKKTEGTTQKKISKVSAQVVRDANNRILSAGSALTQVPNGKRIYLKGGFYGRYVDDGTAAGAIELDETNRRFIDVTVTPNGRFSVIDPSSAVRVLTGTRSATVISKDSVKRAAKSAMSQFRSKK